MNNWNFTGNLGRDAEQKFTQGGDSIVTFSVAVKSGYGDKEKTTWPRCSMFGKRGESVLPYLKKGTQVAVSGELSINEYTDKEGQQKHSVDVRVNDVTLIGGKKTEESEPQRAPQSRPAPSAKKPTFDDMADDVPF